MGYEVVNGNSVEVDSSGRVKTVITGKGKALNFVRAFLNPGTASPEEEYVIHPECDQIEYILYGTGIAEFSDGSTHELQPGVAVYIEAGQPHRFVNNSDEPLVFVVATAVGDKDAEDRIMHQHD